MKLAPICLFTYNRLNETIKTVEALQKNNLADQSELYIFSDGWRDESGRIKIEKVREFLKTIQGFKKVTIEESIANRGLAKSIISGVTKVLTRHDQVIVLEDDLISTPNFLDFMNQGLMFYRENKSIFSISGYTMNLPSLRTNKLDFYLGYRASSWGWGAWKRSWNNIDWEVLDYNEFISSAGQKRSFRKGGVDLPGMLRDQMNGKIDSWAIRWCYNQFKKGQYTIYPTVSKIQSIGFGESATHTAGAKRFFTTIDQSNKTSFIFNNHPEVEEKLTKEFKYKFSFIARGLDKFGL